MVLSACGEKAPGVIAGDVYLAVDLGNEANLAGARISLLADEVEIDSALAKTCPRDMAGQGAAWAARARILDARVRRSVVTDAGAKFTLDSVPPGRYRLWADTTVGKERWTWLHPVKVASGDTTQVVLSNDNPDENPFRCDRSFGP
jgi:hypothetical protein